MMNLPSGDLLEINGHNFRRSSQRLRQGRCEGAEESHDSCESCDRSEEYAAGSSRPLSLFNVGLCHNTTDEDAEKSVENYGQ